MKNCIALFLAAVLLALCGCASETAAASGELAVYLYGGYNQNSDGNIVQNYYANAIGKRKICVIM